MQLSDLLTDYALTRDIERVSLKPVNAAIAAFALHLGRPALVSDLTPKVVNTWLIAEIGRVSRRTARNNRACILTLWRHAYDEDLTDVPPFKIRTIKVPVPVPEAYTPEEVEKLLAACEHLEDTFSRSVVPRKFLYPTLIMVSWHTGFRPGDLMRLRWDCIAPSGSVQIGQHKTQHPVVRYLDADTLEALRRIKRGGVELVFGSYTCEETWRSVFKSLRALAGIDRGSPKWIRRTTATQIAILHGDEAAGRALGHKTPGIARKYYIDARQTLADQLRMPRLKWQKGAG